MKLYKEASLMMLPTSVKDGKLYSIFPQPKPLSGELVTNGTFDTDSDWTKQTGWSISGGSANYDFTTNSTYLRQTLLSSGFVSGKSYRINFEITDGTAYMNIKSNAETLESTNLYSIGSYSIYVTASANGSDLLIYGLNTQGTAFSIDNISVVEVDQLPADFDFSRGSNLAATRINEQGLIEKGRENLLLQSNNFDTSPWTGGSTIFTSGQSGYDGSNDAWLLTHPLSTNSTYQLNTNSGVQTFSIYAKSDGSTGIRLYAFGDANANAYFDLNNGVVRGPSNVINSDIVSVGNGWYRCSITFNQTNSTLRIYTTNNVTTPAAGSVYIQDAQLEAGLVATDYIESGATTGKAGVLEDLPRLNWGGNCPSLLLEPSRTNVITNSEYLVSLNAGSVEYNSSISPEGLQNATKVIFGAAVNDGARMNLTSPCSGNTQYTWSAYVKNVSGTGMFNIRIDTDTTALLVQQDIAATSEWTRVSHTFTTDASATSFNNNSRYRPKADGNEILIWGAQLEQGSYPTSYIPTHGTSVTRSNDFFKIINQESLFSANEGTFFVEFSFNENNKYIGVGDSWPSDKVTIGLNSSGTNQIRSIIRNNGSTINLQGSGTTLGENIKACVSYGLDGFKLFMNGSLQASNSTPANLSQFSDLIPNVDVRDLSSTSNSGNIKQIVVFPTALSDNECINLTTI